MDENEYTGTTVMRISIENVRIMVRDLQIRQVEKNRFVQSMLTKDRS